MNNGTQDNEDVIEDETIEAPEKEAFETIPAGVYVVKLVGFKTVDKPAWRLEGKDGEDKSQWQWTFEVISGGTEDVDAAGTRLVDFTNRSWHEKAKAAHHACALLGIPALVPGVSASTRQLAGKTCQAWVVEVESKKVPGEFRNYIDKLTPMAAPRQRPQRPQAPSTATQKPTVPRVTVPGLGDNMAEPDDIPDEVAW